ncbi:sialate O-acetylesterase [Sphingomonas sp. BK069]|uniref:sialate O-acetylesterase n=1 Tax=Sphingomonas sp. BK069 TaxID=2586979 RepID=UPI0016143899|nr:sialate O-acetylesterase [Sphingomonas sp. BK069]MBB3348413.1 sialate O-acetylesterase [Sphingomonas sp. BK069]
MPIRLARGLAVLLAASAVATPALAAPTLDGAIGEHAVLQRDRPIDVRGTATPGETVMISLAGHSVSATAARDGRFAARLPALPAGGPYELTVAAPSGAKLLGDILIGDVFLCSGQSNMELTVDDAQTLFADAHPPLDPQLRLLTIAKNASATPLDRLATAPRWQAAGPENVGSFSAACFYMVQSLRRTQKVPIGAIHSSWGGSRISAWMSDAALRAGGQSDAAALIALYARDPAAAVRRAIGQWEEWWRGASGDARGKEPWQPDAALDWRAVPALTNFETWGVPELAEYNGMIWYQKTVELTPAQARGPATLSIGTVDDADTTWVNGVGVGSSSLASQPRVYALPAGTLRAGRNVITVNDDDVYALGGMTGPVERMRLTLADGSSVPLDGGWRYAVAKRVGGGAPRVPWDDINGAGTLDNAMIAPLAPLQLAGIAWYQGESDTGLPGYDRRLTALIADWRRRMGTPETGFAVVQLADYGTRAKAPAESGWGMVRDAQRRVTAADPHAGMAVALDLGDALDIHPGEKREIGLRLARAMRAARYGEPVAPAGPAIAGAKRGADGGAVLRFTGATGALSARGAAQAIGFELCGAAAGSCRFAAGTVTGDTVTLAGDGQPVTHVRYAWAETPVVNLFDEAQLPVGTFDVPVE